MNEFDESARKNGLAGFAEVYLSRCDKESELDGIIDIDIYKKLAEIDTKLGVTASEQLLRCLANTSRLDIIQVRFNDFEKKFFQYNFRPSILTKSMNMKA